MKLGFNGVIYYLTTGTRATWNATIVGGVHVGAAPASLARVDSVRDCSIETEKTEVDASSRDTGGYEVAIGALKKLPISFKMIWDPTKASQKAILAAYLSDTPVTIPLAILDGDKATPGTTGWWGDFTVLKMSHGQNLQEGQLIDVTVKPGPSAVNTEYVQVGS